MIPLKVIFVISVLISGLIFTPSYSFAQSNQNDNPLLSFFEMLRQLFSFEDEKPESVTELGDSAIIRTSSISGNENNLPIADAGSPQTVMEFEDVVLDGSNSTDLDGTIVSYQWTQVSGTSVFLENDDTSKPTFEAPDVDLQEILEFMLAVVDDSSGTDTDKVKITVNEKEKEPDDDVNNLPIADAGSPQTVMEFEDVVLDGSNSTDLDGTIVSYQWTQVSGTSVFLENDDTSKPTFEAPDVDLQEILEFMLAVVDDSSGTDTDKVKITVNEKEEKPDEETDNNKDKNKVTICHVPPGNPDNAHTITVGESAVVAHIAHGDSLDDCGDDNENKKANSGKGNSGIDNSGKGNSNDKDENEKSNSGKGNSHDEDNENKKANSGKGNSGIDNSGKGNSNDKKDDNKNKSNSKLKNNNDDETKNEDDHEDEGDDENEDD